MLRCKITPYCAFDCSKHPMKANTNNERSNKRAKAQKCLTDFYNRGKDSTIELDEVEHADALKNVKLLSCPNEQLLSLVIE